MTSRAYFLSASKLASALSLVTVRPLRKVVMALSRASEEAPLFFKACPAGVAEAAIAERSRSCATKLSPACWAVCSATSRTRISSGVAVGIPAPDPSTLGSLAKACSTSALTASGLPPAVRISDEAAPSGSSNMALSKCSGVSCWLKSRTAMVCAAWRNPRERSVNFSIFIICSLVPLIRRETPLFTP